MIDRVGCREHIPRHFTLRKQSIGQDLPRTRLAFARPHSLRAAPIVQLLLIASLSMGVGVVGRHSHNAAETSG